jgi:polar amino acid transport system ATP-binding protein
MELHINRLRKSYDREVLHGLDLDLSGYDSIGIIGRSGCGKSTLLRLLAGMEATDAGEISINGMAVTEKNRRIYQKTIGMVFQQHNLFPHLSLERNISLILEEIDGMKKDQAQKTAQGHLTQLHLEEEMDKRPEAVSGGQAQRAAIARALSIDPDLIFMDEPTAALDPILTREVLDAVVDLRDSGKDFIFVTHEMSFVRDFADYVLFMEDGVIVEQGGVGILAEPKTQALKKFLEHEQMNEPASAKRKGVKYGNQGDLRII